MAPIKLPSVLIALVALMLSGSCLAAAYHVYDWKGDAKVKDGREVRESEWQPGFVLTSDGLRRVGEITVTTVDGRIAEVRVKGDGERRKTYATGDLKEFGLLLSVADFDRKRASERPKFGPGTLELSDGRRLEGQLGAATLDDGSVFCISYAPDRESHLTSYFSRSLERAVMTIDGIEMEYLSFGDGISKLPTLAEYRSFQHRDDSRNPHQGSMLLPDGEQVDGPVLLVKDDDDGPAYAAMMFDEDGYGVIRTASELSRVTQVIDGRTHYWTSYGAELEQLPVLKNHIADRHRDQSRNAHPGEIILRNEMVLKGSVAFDKTRDGVNSIEVLFFDNEGVPWSYGGSDVVQVMQQIDGKVHRYSPYQDLVFVELMARGQPYQIHANPFPEREDQFKTTLTRGLVSALIQGAAYQLGQENMGNAAVIGVFGCEASGSCSSRNSLREGVETMVPAFKKDEFVFRRADGAEVVLIKQNFDNEVQPLLLNCPDYQALSRKQKKALLDFDHPERAVAFLNECPDENTETHTVAPAGPVRAEPGSVYQDELRIGAKGPAMVVVPAGQYRMGDHTDSHANEIPIHRVRFEHPFSVSQYEITLEEFDLFTSHTGRVERTGQLSKQKRSAVRGIAWIDAVAYAQWLSHQTGHHYRLPTEAEWEYAARAGAETSYPWGEQVSTERVQCESCGSRKSRSEDVGQYPENNFGLYDVSGNAWEWVADCWHPEYSGAPGDGSAWMDEGDCNLRVVRGGSAENGANELRVSFRTASSPVKRGSFVGFRLVRDF